MLRWARRTGALAALILATLAGTAVAGPRTSELVFRVISFNVRFEFESDAQGGNQWANRHRLIAELVANAKASVVCFQEDKSNQVEDLKRDMPGWEFVGQGRDGRGSEHCSVAFKTDEWRCLEHGDFWLSDTPEKVASNTWGCKYPHKVTWATLEALKDVKHRTVTFTSTHLDEHREMDEVRRKSAEVIRRWIAKNAPKSNVIVCGDFNSGTESTAHQVLADQNAKPRLVDSFEVVGHEARSGTVHNFTGKTGSKRIDWIFVGGNVNPRDTRVERYASKDGHYPSDHFAVSCEVEIGADLSGHKPATKPEGKAAPDTEEPRPAAEAPKPEAPKPAENPDTKPATGETPDSPPPVEPGLSPLDPEPAPKKK